MTYQVQFKYFHFDLSFQNHVNSNFCISQDPDNIRLKEKILEIKKKLADNLPSIPSLLSDELKCNIFLKAKDLKSFSKLRDLKDNF